MQIQLNGAYEDGQVVDKLPKAAAFLGKGIAQSAALLGPKVASSAQELHSALQQFSLLNLATVSILADNLAREVESTIPLNTDKLHTFALNLSALLHEFSTSLSGNHAAPDAEQVAGVLLSTASTLAGISATLPYISANFIAAQKSCEEVIIALNRSSNEDLGGFLQSERLAMVASVIGFVAFLVASYLPAPISLWYMRLIVYFICLLLGLWRSHPKSTSPVIALLLAFLCYFILGKSPQSDSYMHHHNDAKKMPCYNPEKLITLETVGTIQSLVLNRDLLERLTEYPPPFYIHTSAGVYRSGKSTSGTIFIRSLFPSENFKCKSHFPMCHSSDACTEGIWVWAMPVNSLNSSMVPPSMNSNGTLLLVDTEGLADPAATKNLVLIEKLFSIATLLSSSLTIHSFRNFDHQELLQLSSVGTLARMMGVDALRAARKGDESEQEEDVTGEREATEGDEGEQMRELLPNLNVLITSADLMANLPGMRNGTYSIGDKLEDILQNEHVKEIKATLRYLFSHRRMFGGARASDVEITELQKLDLEPGIPDHPFSKSLVVIWRQLLMGVAAKKFAGKEVDGVRLRYMVETMHQTITQAAGVFKESLTLESLFAFYKNLTWHEAKQIIQQEQDRLKYNLVHGGVTGLKALTKKLGDMERACEERISILSEKVPNIGGDVLESLRTEVKDKINGTSEYLLDILVKMDTFEWIPEEWGVCQCPGSRERNVTCRRKWDDVMVADERCSKLVKPEAKEKCQAAGFSWKYSEWEKCEGECPGYQKRSLQCTYCGTERKHDNDCKHLDRPQIPARSCQNYTYMWKTSKWSLCTEECGGGTQERSVKCMRCDGKEADGDCRDATPSQKAACNTQECGKVWLYVAFVAVLIIAILLERRFSIEMHQTHKTRFDQRK